MALTKALQKRIDEANKYIKFAQKHGIWGRGYFGSTMESVFTYPHLITVSPTGRSVRVRYHDAYGGGKHKQSFNTNDPDRVSDLRYEITHYVIGAIKRGAKDEGRSIPKTLSNPTKRKNIRGGSLKILPGGKLQVGDGKPFDPEQEPKAKAARRALKQRKWSKFVEMWLTYVGQADHMMAESVSKKFIFRRDDEGPKYEYFEALKIIDPFGWKTARSPYKKSNPRKRKTYEWTDDGKPGRYKVVEGFDHRKGKPIYQVVGVNNDYVGEWHTSKASAQRELKATLEEDRYDNPRKRKNSQSESIPALEAMARKLWGSRWHENKAEDFLYAADLKALRKYPNANFVAAFTKHGVVYIYILPESRTRWREGQPPAGVFSDGNPTNLESFRDGERFFLRSTVTGAKRGLKNIIPSHANDIVDAYWREYTPPKKSNPRKRNKALTRKQKENAIAKKFPPDSKRGRGDKREIMLTGDSAKVLGVSNYTVVRMASDLTNEQIDTLYDFLVLRKRSNPRKRRNSDKGEKYAQLFRDLRDKRITTIQLDMKGVMGGGTGGFRTFKRGRMGKPKRWRGGWDKPAFERVSLSVVPLDDMGNPIKMRAGYKLWLSEYDDGTADVSASIGDMGLMLQGMKKNPRKRNNPGHKGEVNPYSKRYTYMDFTKKFWGKNWRDVPRDIRLSFWDDFKLAFVGGLQKYKEATRG